MSFKGLKSDITDGNEIVISCRIANWLLRTGQGTKTDEFSENFQGGGGVIFNPKIYFADILDLFMGYFRTFSEKMQHNFPKMRVGGQRPFPENSSVLVP